MFPLNYYLLARENGCNLLVITYSQREAEEIFRELVELTEDSTITPLLFPEKGIPFFDESLPHPSISITRVKTLLSLIEEKKIKILITPVSEIVWKVVSPEEIQSNTLLLKKNLRLRRDYLIRRLIELGYEVAERVENHGEVAFRGGIVDFMPPESNFFIRVDYFGEEIEEIKKIDPEKYTTIEVLDDFEVTPIRESFIPENAFSRLKAKLVDSQSSIKKSEKILEEFQEKGVLPFPQFTLPLIHEMKSLTGLVLEKNFCLRFHGDDLTIERGYLENLYKQIASKYIEIENFPVPLEELLVEPEELHSDLEKMRREDLEASPITTIYESFLPLTEDKVPIFKRALEQKKLAGYRIVFFYLTSWEREQLSRWFPESREADDLDEVETLDPGIYLLRKNISHGIEWEEKKITFIGREEWQEIKKISYRISKGTKRKIELTLRDIRPGDYVVHEDHGIGRYMGLVRFEKEGEFIQIQYADGKLYVPILKLDKVSPYIGEEEPELSELGSSKWKKLKERARKDVEQLAIDLLKLYSEREAHQGFQFSPPGEFVRAVEESFPFEETPDQKKAIEETLEDMQSPRPMDRLICGDAGFGKTEVAIRAAVKAVEDGKQVVMLAPTTVLSLQHYRVISERVSGLPIRVELLNRLVPQKKQKQIIEDIKKGRVDIVVGTHRLLSRDINFRDLGLIIIDEEQRFGVKQKEKLRKLKATVDTLTLTATPIPRTLHTSLSGLKAISVITTPPRERQEVETKIISWDQNLIRSIIRKELDRKGQVFILFNRIEGLEKIYEEVRELVPDARITYAHGRMHPDELEKKILAFYNGEYDIFISTTIIESGLDIPNANTIIVINAHLFGLAELYQLRGRVGRSSVKGYAYLVIPPGARLTKKALKRLEVLKSFAKLGSGFKIALKDLEIRGAGELLGKKQHGFMSKLGYDLYLKLLQKTIKKMKGELSIEEETEIKTSIPAFIPDDYIDNIEDRLEYYYKLSTATDEDSLKRIIDEMEEIYGEIPEEVNLLARLYLLKNRASLMKIREIHVTESEIKIYPSPQSEITPGQLINLSRKYKNFSFTETHISYAFEDLKKGLAEVVGILGEMMERPGRE